MNPFDLKGTEHKPTVFLSKEANHFEISGRSIPEDVKAFYSPILDWLEEYSTQANSITNFTIRLDYFNTASSMMIFAILLKLKQIQEKSEKVIVNWYYADEDIYEAGIDYSDAVQDLTFKLIEDH